MDFPTKAKQLARMDGVDAIVAGAISDLGTEVDVDARVVEMETNRILDPGDFSLIEKSSSKWYGPFYFNVVFLNAALPRWLVFQVPAARGDYVLRILRRGAGNQVDLTLRLR